jgi:TetR/AcrR family transcriptional regulator, transcriptional repressor for nem operon
MPRPREFDSGVALDRAMQVFWSKGYEATSLDELCEAMTLSRSSVYAAFGDKRALLLRTLQHYSERGSERIARVLENDRPIREAVAALLDEFIDAIVAGPGRRGCFIGNCAAELARDDREAMSIVCAAIERNEGYFRRALEAAQKRGEIRESADVAALARFMTASIQGMRLVGKAKPDRAALRDVATMILRCLDG